ncbi:MAG: hypothetical protein MUO21_10770 [Nitrososphaeraceae archaeon]|nr:hypothetical protein [Nitrososphaeraceae archaeon]
MRKIGSILTTLSMIEFDFENLIDCYNFNIHYYEKFNKVTSYNINETINKLREKIIEMKNRQDEELDIVYSDEFLDPITYSPIDEPCLLPDMVGFSGGDVYFDRSTIAKQLLIKDENPYTRKPLTIEQFNEFNAKQYIMEKLQDFKKRFSQEKETKKNNKKMKI